MLDKKQKTRLDGRTKVNWRGSRRSSRNSRTMPKISDTSSNRISRKRFHLSKIWRRSTMNSAELPGLIYGSGSSILDGLSMLCLQGFLSQFSLGLLVHGILSWTSTSTSGGLVAMSISFLTRCTVLSKDLTPSGSCLRSQLTFSGSSFSESSACSLPSSTTSITLPLLTCYTNQCFSTTTRAWERHHLSRCSRTCTWSTTWFCTCQSFS